MIRRSHPTSLSPIGRLITTLCVAATLVASATASIADTHGDDSARIGYRQKVMSAIGTNMGAIGDIMKNQLALPGAVANHANQMADAAALIAPAFRKRITDGATDAQPAIWDDWAKFEEAIAQYEEAARALADAATNDPSKVGAAMRGLGKSCGGCHKPFRKPKEESYKNQ